VANDANQVPSTADAAASEPLTLDEFCMRFSQVDRRVELIGAFHYVEKSAGRQKDTEEAYRARFDAFVNAPV
jgi:hypothetical protein